MYSIDILTITIMEYLVIIAVEFLILIVCLTMLNNMR